MRKNTITAATGFIVLVTSSGCSSSTEEAVGRSESKQTVRAFCPNAPVPRKDMARYLERLKHGRDFAPPPARGQFADVKDPTDQKWAEALARDGITKGCGFVQEGAGWGVRYVLWGSPAALSAPEFWAVKSRANTDLYQYGTVHLSCDYGGNPQASFNTFEGPSFGGTSFPTHHAWLFRGDQEAGHEHVYREQSSSLDPDGAGFKDLWYLKAVPPP